MTNPVTPTPKKRKPRRFLSRPAPSITPEDLAGLPAGPRVVVPYPPGELSPNARTRWGSIKKKKSYRRDCAFEAWSAGLHKLRHLVRAIEGDVPVRIDFFPPPSALRMDHDNMIAAFKAGQDGIADTLAIDDRRFAPAYRFHQEPRSCVVFTLTSLGEDACTTPSR